METYHSKLVYITLGGVLDLNLYGDVLTKIFYYLPLEILPSNDTQF